MAVAVADLVDNYFVESRVTLANGDRGSTSTNTKVEREAVQLSKVYIYIWIYMYLQQPNICHRIGKFYSIA